MHRSLTTVLLVLSALVASAHLKAAELGEAVVKSYLGQNLVADVELIPDGGGAVEAHISSPDVYKGAGLALPAILPNLFMSVMRRDGRQYLHLTTVQPVNTEVVHLFFNLIEGGKSTVRPVSLWLKADPNPPPPPVPVAEHKPAAHKAAGPHKLSPEEEAAKACITADFHNEQLKAQIIELEEKVAALQAQLEKPPEPKAKPLVQPLKLPPPPKVEKKAETPWLLYGGIGVIVLMLAGAGYVIWRKRKGRAAAPKGPSLIAKIKLMMMLRRKQKEEAQHVEPNAE